MKTLSLLAVLLAFITAAIAQETNSGYDAELAKSLGADEYGMKSYILVILKTGTNQTTDKNLTDSLFRGHMQNINRMAEQGLLVVAGPFFKNDNQFRGIFILNVTTSEEANALLQTDPAIKENLLAFDIYKWYGSAALPEYLKVHHKIEKKAP